MKVFISQPMSGKTEQEVREARAIAEKFLKEKFGDELELIDSTYDPGFKEDEVKHFSAMCLAYSLTKMAEADDAYTLTSGGSKQNPGTPMEGLYANYANQMKGLANSARKEYLATPNL
jgi:ribosomal protein S6E (S10)